MCNTSPTMIAIKMLRIARTRTLDRVHNGVWSRRWRRSRHLMSTTRQRAKRKAPSQFANCLTSLVAGARCAQRRPEELGVPMEAVIAA
jgi:hypothetical protein